MLDHKQNSVHKYFLSEMEYLRSRAVEFSKDYPKIAQELRLSAGKSADPHIELLMQSFAYLTGTLRSDMEAESTQIPNQLLGTLYPHLATPAPAMTVLQLGVLPGKAEFKRGWPLERGRQFFCYEEGTKGTKVRCSFTSTYDIGLLPLEVSEVSLVPTNSFSFDNPDYTKAERELRENLFTRAQSIIRVKLRNKKSADDEDGEPIQNYKPDKVTLYIDGHELNAYEIYTLLASNLLEVGVRNPDNEKVQLLGEGKKRLVKNLIKWRGFSDRDAVLPFKASSHKAYRMIQEFFLFPEKYLFFDLEGIDSEEFNQELEILFLLDADNANKLKLKNHSFRINCVPAVNLYRLTLEPVRLSQQDHEYRLIGDAKNHAYCEVHSIEEVVSIYDNAGPTILSPYIGLSPNLLGNDEYSYSTRITRSNLKSVPGTETYISFHNSNFELNNKPSEVISVSANCTNRRLPEFLHIGDKLHIEGAAPVDYGQVVLKPSRHHSPRIEAGQPWYLVSNLSLNLLPLLEKEKDPRGMRGDSITAGKVKGASVDGNNVDALKKILRLYCCDGVPYHFAQIESIDLLSTRTIYKRIGKEAWRGFCTGIEVTIQLDEQVFDGGSPVMFAEVLRRFFALYTSVNQLVQFVLISKQRKGIWKQWDPLVGEQLVL